MCVDFRNPNVITTKDEYLVPINNELLGKLRRAKIFTRLNIFSAYNMIRMALGHKWKTSVRITDGCFEWLVMPFGLTNALPTWQALIDRIFRDTKNGTISHVDDFLIFASSKVELLEPPINFLQKLKSNNLYCKLSKCAFEVESVDFFGFCISETGITIYPNGIATITDSPIHLFIYLFHRSNCWLTISQFMSRKKLPRVTSLRQVPIIPIIPLMNA